MAAGLAAAFGDGFFVAGFFAAGFGAGFGAGFLTAGFFAVGFVADFLFVLIFLLPRRLTVGGRVFRWTCPQEP